PDGTTLAVGGTDTTITLYDVSGAGLPEPWTKKPTSPARLWENFEKGNGTDGWAALRELASNPEPAVRSVKEKVKLTVRLRLTPAEVAKLIAQLDAPAFAEREAAGRTLRAYGRSIEPAVRKVLRETASAEARERLEKLVEGLNKPPAINVLEVRAVE